MKRINVLIAFFVSLCLLGFAEQGITKSSSNEVNMIVSSSAVSDSIKSKNISKCLSFLSNKDSAALFAYHFSIGGEMPSERIVAEYLYENGAF